MGKKMNELAKKIIFHKTFEWFIAGVILLNCFFIGVETYYSTPIIHRIQYMTLGIFTIEIILRWIARETLEKFFLDG